MSTEDTALAAGQGDDEARAQDSVTSPASEPALGADMPFENPEAAALAAARAEVEAEERNAKGEAEPASAPQQEQQQPASEAPTNPDPPQQRRPGPVPYDRFAEVAKRTRLLEEENAYLRGVVEATKGQQPPSQQAAPPEPAAPATPDAVIAAAKQRVKDAAERFDSGEITAAELTTIQTEAAEEIAAARVEALIRQNQPAPSVSVTDELLMEQHVQQLQAEYPVLNMLNEQQMQFLKYTAEQEAAVAGQPYRSGPRETIRLRNHVARLATAFAPYWGIKVPQAASSATGAPQSNAQPARQAGLSPQAQSRLAKMDLAAGLPPDTARFGQSAAGAGDVTEQQILAMTDDERAALPPTIKARFLF